MKKIENELNNRRLYLNDLTEGVKTLLLSSPEGSLRANTKNGKPQYYVRTDTKDRTGKYIKKEDIELAKAIANRDYLKKVEEKAEMELDAIVKLLEILQMGTVEDVYEGLILPRKELVTPVAVSDEEYARQWLAQPYRKKGFEEGDPEVYTDRGERVRSKSEALLFNAFCGYELPTKYEVPVKLWNGKVIHPDFDILNIRTREEFRWEHFGKADNPEYMRYNIGRLNDLMLTGYLPGVNLILTFETENKPLDMRIVHALIKKFLL